MSCTRYTVCVGRILDISSWFLSNYMRNIIMNNSILILKQEYTRDNEIVSLIMTILNLYNPQTNYDYNTIMLRKIVSDNFSLSADKVLLIIFSFLFFFWLVYVVNL